MSDQEAEETLDIRATLRVFVRAQEDGCFLDWTAIQAATGVTMDQAGRAELRGALRAENIGFLSRRGKGIEFTSAGNAVVHNRQRVSGLLNHTKRIEKTTRKDLERHESKMSTSDKQELIRSASFLSTVRMSGALAIPLTKTLPVFRSEKDKAAE